MRKTEEKPFHIRPVLCRTKRRTVRVALCAIVLSLAVLLALDLGTAQAKAERDALAKQAAELEQAHDTLQDRLNSAGTPEGLKEIAQEELGLVDPNTILLDPVN